jgi:hypothetical protein
MSTLKDEAEKLLDQYYAGLYTLSETHWRLLQLVEEVSQIDKLIATLPNDIASSWVDWAGRSYRHAGAERVSFGGPPAPRDEASVKAVEEWLTGYDASHHRR